MIHDVPAIREGWPAGSAVRPTRRQVSRVSLIRMPHATVLQVRQWCHFFQADEEYGKRVAEQLGIDITDISEALKTAGKNLQPA